MFSYHGSDGPESNTTLRCEEVRQRAVPVGRETTTSFVVEFISRTGVEVCYVRLTFFIVQSLGGAVRQRVQDVAEVRRRRRVAARVHRLVPVSDVPPSPAPAPAPA